MSNKKQIPDKRPTISEWPVRIWSIEELPPQYDAQVRGWLKNDFSDYDFVHAPKRSSNDESFDYMFGYGNDRILYIAKDSVKAAKSLESQCNLQMLEIEKQQITKVLTERELLNAKIILHYHAENGQSKLQLPYVPSVYYLYDPFLNWLLGLEKEFVPAVAEAEHPRPEKLYHESLAMYNYSMGAYRLGSGFSEYQYESKPHRCKWMPWKKTLEEWLKIQMERGLFELHSFGYFTECVYHIS